MATLGIFLPAFVFVTWQLAGAALVDVPSTFLAALAAALLLRYRLNSAWLVLGGSIVGLLLRWTLLV